MRLLGAPLFVLHVDGVGEYAMRHEDGTRCLFLFTSEESLIRFVELMERPDHREFSCIPLDSMPVILTFLREIRQLTQMIAIDPLANCDFSPVAIDDILAFYRLDD